jgi:hypothetical protein
MTSTTSYLNMGNEENASQLLQDRLRQRCYRVGPVFILSLMTITFILAGELIAEKNKPRVVMDTSLSSTNNHSETTFATPWMGYFDILIGNCTITFIQAEYYPPLIQGHIASQHPENCYGVNNMEFTSVVLPDDYQLKYASARRIYEENKFEFFRQPLFYLTLIIGAIMTLYFFCDGV